MAASFFCKADPYNKNYHIEGQHIRSSVRNFSDCKCFKEPGCNVNFEYAACCKYKTCKECCKCGRSVLTMNWSKISKFMNTNKEYRYEIGILINQTKFMPLTQRFSKCLLLNQKIKNFDSFNDYNAFVVAFESNKFKLYMFTKFAKNIISDGICKTIDEIELCKININPKTTILTPNWNGDGSSRWLV